MQLGEELAAEDGGGVNPLDRDLQALQHLDPRPQHLPVGDRGVHDAVVATAVGFAALGQRVVVGSVPEELRELAAEHGLPVAPAEMRDRVEPEVLLGEVGDDVRRHRAQTHEMALEIGLPGAGDREHRSPGDASPAGDEAHEVLVGQVDEMSGGHGR